MRWFNRPSVMVSAAFCASTIACAAVAHESASPPPAPSGAATATPAPEPPAPKAPAPFTRLVEDPSGVMTLELASRSYRRADGSGPTVHLVGAIHIADKSFYDAKQEELDRCDLVLFEGVKSAGMGEIAATLDDAGKADATAKRMKFLTQLAVGARERTGHFAKDLAGLAADVGRFGAFVERSKLDGWGRPFAFVAMEIPATDGAPVTERVQMRSLGADGEEGGEGTAADIVVDSDPVRVDRAASNQRSDNLQARMAKLLGVAFQLDAMDSTKANWRNSDMDIDALRVLLEKSGPDAARILRMLDGTTFEAKIAGLFLSIIGTSKTLSAAVKVVLLESLSSADGPFDALGSSEALQGMQRAIIDDRNRIVLDDLKRVIASEGDKKSIAIFYGAGHMPSFERCLREEFGLTPVADAWTPAMRVDPKETGLSKAEWKRMREMVGSMTSRMRSAPKEK